MGACQSPHFGIVAHFLVGCSVRLWHFACRRTSCAPHRAVFGPTPHRGRLASLCSPYVWRSATPSPLTAPAPCIIHALLLLAREGELRCHFSLLSAAPAPLVQASTAAVGWSCGRAVVQLPFTCYLARWALDFFSLTRMVQCTCFCCGDRCFSCSPPPPPSPAHPRSLVRCSSQCVLLLSLSTVCIWMPFFLFLGRVLRRVDARQAQFEFHQ